MKRISILLAFIIVALHTSAQKTAEKTMESRAREMYRVIGLTSKEQYKKFMLENYNKEFLERPVKINRIVSNSGGESSTSDKKIDNLEAKADMYAQLHEDFGGSKIISITQKENVIDMVLKANSGLTGTFTLTFEKTNPYLIMGMGVQAEMKN